MPAPKPAAAPKKKAAPVEEEPAAAPKKTRSAKKAAPVEEEPAADPPKKTRSVKKAAPVEEEPAAAPVEEEPTAPPKKLTKLPFSTILRDDGVIEIHPRAPRKTRDAPRSKAQTENDNHMKELHKRAKVIHAEEKGSYQSAFKKACSEARRS